MKKQIQIVKDKFDNSRLSNKTTPPKHRKIRKIGLYIFAISSGVIAGLATGGVTTPVWITVALKTAAVASGIISGNSHLQKTK